MPALEVAGIDAEYFLLDSEYGHSASGIDAHKWAPKLDQFMERLASAVVQIKSRPSSHI
jgi:homoserine O-acetyltransferase